TVGDSSRLRAARWPAAARSPASWRPAGRPPTRKSPRSTGSASAISFPPPTRCCARRCCRKRRRRWGSRSRSRPSTATTCSRASPRRSSPAPVPTSSMPCTTISPFQYRRSEVLRLAIHVRRGELFAIFSDWMLPNSYYVSAVLRFQRILRKLEIPFVCELYTEVASKAFVVTPQHHGIFGRISDNVTFDPAMNHLEDFDAVPNLERFINFDPIESLRRMATADALILSHSSFSYLPAILNQNCIVIYHPYWRSPMKDWLISDDNGTLPESDLVKRLESWKRAAICT